MVPLREVTAAVVSGLATATGKNIGDSVAPADTTLPYAIVYRLPGGAPWSALNHGHEYATVTLQITSVGALASQAEWMKDQARTAMLDLSNFTPPSGFRFEHVNPDLDGGVSRDDDLGTEPLFYGVDRFRLWVVPA